MWLRFPEASFETVPMPAVCGTVSVGIVDS